MSQTKDRSPRSSVEKVHKGSAVYRRAILVAIDSLQDYQSRSNIDLIRRHTQDHLEDHTWNDTLFLKTLKNIVQCGDIQQSAIIYAELSPEYKKKRAGSIAQQVEHHLQSAPPLPISTASLSQSVAQTKPSPVRRSEHEKWKIIPKRIFDRSVVVNPMDTH